MIKISFVALTITMASLLIAGIRWATKKTMTEPEGARFMRKTVVAISLWLGYVSIISVAGVLQTTSLPPRIPLLLIIPLFSFIVFAVRTQSFRKMLAVIPSHVLIYPQVFRIAVEFLLVALCYRGLVPRAGTFEGYNFEIVVAITALATGYIAYKKKDKMYVAIYLWNICGLLTLATVVFILISHVYFPSIYANPEKLDIEDFGAFPYTLLAGFLMPLAVFLHIASLMKLRSVK